MTELSVIIPVLNDAAMLATALNNLDEQDDVDLEVIVADGGSVDDAADIARSHGATFVVSASGRGTQMNSGRLAANGEYLLFLHADCSFTEPRQLRNALDRIAAASPTTAGHFRLKFFDCDGGFKYRYLEAKTRLNRLNTTNGDQGLLLRASLFDDVGGYDERMNFLEDQRIAETIRRSGTLITLPGTLRTSARRFETEGFGRRYLLMAITMGCFDAGVDQFFDYAPRVYPVQEDTGALDLMPYFQAIWKVTITRGAFDAWWDVGKFIRKNAWQIPFALDVRFGTRRMTAFFDRYIAPAMNNVVVDMVSFVVSLFCFAVLFPAIVWVLDRHDEPTIA